MITLKKIRDLDLSNPATPGRPSHLSAASGLVCVNSFVYVIADDELHLGVFRASDSGPGHLIRLFDGVLPVSKSDRKNQKPDLEALTLLPAYKDHPHGALLALGSGSRRGRRMGALLALDAQGAVCSPPRVIDLSPMLAPLDDEFSTLNIEGAIVSGSEMLLFQRCNKQRHENAVIRFQLSAVLNTLSSGRIGAIKPIGIHAFDLGKVDGIPLCFTDAAALPNGEMIFTAVAEDTEDAYADGLCAGAAIGIAGGDGLRLVPLDRPYKIEGIDARMDGNVIRLLLVTDPDDADIPAGLFSTAIGR
jgi:hypothetical protein